MPGVLHAEMSRFWQGLLTSGQRVEAPSTRLASPDKQAGDSSALEDIASAGDEADTRVQLEFIPKLHTPPVQFPDPLFVREAYKALTNLLLSGATMQKVSLVLLVF